MNHRRALVAAAVLVLALTPLAACGGGDNGAADAGADGGKDTGVKPDTGAPDTGAPDTGDMDSGGADSSDDAADSGPGDGGGADSGLGYNFMVVRTGGSLGDGGFEAGLTTAAAPVFLEERRSSDGSLVRSLALPQAANGNNQPFTLDGISTTEGGLTRSANGSYVVLGGYAAVPGTAAVSSASSSTTNRVIARVAANGTIDTTTRLNAAFSGVSIRGVGSNDGTAFWASGENGSASSGGVHYVTFGQTGGASVFSTVQNMRQVGVFDGQLYADTQSTAGNNTLRVFSIGSGLPTTANQTGTNLPGVTTMNTTPNGFVLLDLNNNVAGVDTGYFADTRSINSGGGVQKWTYDGQTWTLKATFAQGITSPPYFVTAAKVGNDVVVIASVQESPNRLVRYIDDGQNMNPNGFALTTAQPSTNFRGVAVSPQ